VTPAACDALTRRSAAHRAGRVRRAAGTTQNQRHR
jgi:hypothetical protein